jgi:hypothetical protein
MEAYTWMDVERYREDDKDEIARLTKQRDALLETVIELLNGPECGGDHGAMLRNAKALVVSVKGGAA